MSSPSRLIIWSDVSVVLVSGRTLLEATTCAAIAFREERGGCWEPSLVAGEGWGEIGMGGGGGGGGSPGARAPQVFCLFHTHSISEGRA